MKIFSLLFLLGMMCISCGGTSEAEAQPETTLQDTLRYGKTAYVFPKLSKNAAETTENWLAYADFTSEATTLHDLSFEELRDKTNRLLVHTDSLQSKIPDTLSVEAIHSRLTIVNTRVALLKQEINKARIHPDKIETHINETNNAIKNFIIQVNEKFQKDNIDLQRIDTEKKELEKQKRFLDSVYQAELKDQQSP